MKEVYAPDGCYLSVKLDSAAIEKLHLEIDAHAVRRAILKGCPGQTRPAVLRALKDVHVVRGDKLRIPPPDALSAGGGGAAAAAALAAGGAGAAEQRRYFVMQALKATLPAVIVQGLPTISRAIVNETKDDATGATRYHLLVEGYGLAEVMGAPGVKGTESKSNHIIEVENTLGVEAARTVIQNEIEYIMRMYGIDIDRRHMILLSDVMTFKGEVLGITRFGVSKMKESVMMLASFEKTTDHLFDAAVHGRTDTVAGVSECIIMGQSVPLGSGLFKLLRAAEQPAAPSPPDLLLS